MTEELEKILGSLSDAGCGSLDLKKAKLLYEAGDADALIRHFRKCRCDLMEELHKSQRKVDCMDYLIRQTEKAKRAVGKAKQTAGKVKRVVDQANRTAD